MENQEMIQLLRSIYEQTKSDPSIEETKTTKCLYLFVMTYGWVLKGVIKKETEKLYVLDSAENIERWGTDQGIGQLVDGYTEETRARKICADTEITKEQIIFKFKVKS